jgi:hypothetical protein
MLTRLLAAALALSIAGAIVVAARGQPSPTGTPSASPARSPIASPSPVPEGRAVSVAGSVTIDLHDGWFDPSYVEATNGHPLAITLVNRGSRRHSFKIDRYDVDVSLAPGESKTIVIESPDLGDFTYYSDAPGDLNMKGQLTFYI